MQRSRRGRGWRLQSMIRSLDHLDQSFQWWVMTVDWTGWRGILQRVAVCSVGGFQADEVTEGLVEGAHPPSQPWRMESTLAGPFPSPLAARFTSAHVPPHDCSPSRSGIQWPHGAGTCQKTMFVVSARSTLTGRVRLVNTQATTAACYRGNAATTFTWFELNHVSFVIVYIADWGYVVLFSTVSWNGSSKIHQGGNAQCVVNVLSGMSK
ncbi:hypothetical protein LB507_003562 [Fusarium sp. FIESC RH6]|nr:hypothetical protein LB507_003562 [Fusarium sp. FIESC RH6]